MSITSINILNEDDIFESCAIEVKVDNNQMIVAGIYRTPSENIESFLNKLNIFLAELCKINYNILLGGDIKVDVLREDSRKVQSVNVLKMHGFYYTVKIPTRITETIETATDNFITNIKHNLFEVEYLITLLSDHNRLRNF